MGLFFEYTLAMVPLTDALQKLSNKIFRWIPQQQPPAEQISHLKIVAHRGAWNTTTRLENSMAAFLACLQHDIWAIEFDLRWTSDQIPVVHHDANTQRVFHQDLVISETKFGDLRKTLPQIPTLKEVIKELGGKIHFMIELKALLTPQQRGILKALLSELRPIQDYHFMSLDPNRFKALDFVDKKALVSIARTNIHRIYQETLDNDWGALTGQYLLVTRAMTEDCHKHNIKVGTGFPDSKNLLFREAHRDVDWLFTNQAEKMARLKTDYSKK